MGVASSVASGLHLLSGRSLLAVGLAVRETHQQRTKPLDGGWSCLQTATKDRFFARESSGFKQINILARWFIVGMQARALFSHTHITKVEYATRRKGNGGIS